MGQLPYWHSVELSAGSRPVLREKEVDVLVENSIGLYQGKSKILNRQNGRIYMTSQRLIYIDNNDAKTYSVAIELNDIDHIDYTAKFLKSSPKITIFLKKIGKQKKSKKRSTEPIRTTTWICPICTFPNNVQTNVNPNNQEYLPACETCGIKATSQIIQDSLNSYRTSNKSQDTSSSHKPLAPKQIACPICTFLNHPSLRNCEICDTQLPANQENNSELENIDEMQLFDDRIQIKTESNDGLDDSPQPFIKLSFHKVGDKFFFNKLNENLEKFKWDIVLNSGNANKDSVKLKKGPIESQNSGNSTMGFGIHSLARQEELKTQKNEEIINSSLDDLQALLNRANEILELTESFKKLNSSSSQSQEQSTPLINQVTKNLLFDSNDESQRKLYLQEIARQLSDFLINDSVLDQEGGIITLLDLYALFNRGRIGINLISPEELYKSCEFFETLKLPLLFKKINNILVVQDLKFSDEGHIVDDIKKFIINFGDQDQFSFKSANILKISDAFNWSITITEEILKIGIALGELVVDQQVSGKFYYLNEFCDLDSFDEKRYQESKNDDGSNEIPIEVGTSDKVIFTSSHPQESMNGTPESLSFPDAPKTQPFPEAPTSNVKTNDRDQNYNKSQSLLQLEGLQI